MKPDKGAHPEMDASQAEEQAAPQPAAAAASADPIWLLVREAADYKDKLLRALADMENLRKRTEREVADSRLYGITSFARDILNVADNMHRALNALDVGLRERADASVKALLDGVELTERELLNALEKHGVKKLEPVGLKFDPNMHQAMYEVPDSTAPAGHVVQGIQAGYMIVDRCLRPALAANANADSKAEPYANDNSG